MTQPYGKPYTVRGWGDEVVTTVSIGGDPPPGYTAVIRGTEPGPVILVPTAALTPVDTTPAEPEPGACIVGKTLCVRPEVANVRARWLNLDDCDWYDWPELWRDLGGPDVTIRRLIAEPAPVEPVQLPWTMDGGHATVELGPTLRLAGGCDSLYMGRDEAIGLGRALIEAGERTAARAAREATS